MKKVDERYLRALLGTVGKTIASQPHAKRVVDRMRLARSPADLAHALQGVDLGVDEAAREAIWEAATDDARWRETHALLVRSAEQHIVERFSASS